ncbi:bifunctional diguanylate cyclase/phosphodiesterase [Arsukibacterium sp.]|uniref:putative bifunctional diguanylate cyclase/phosphodiesterase n=1 Tax=Arsukibacterium sp. TaxID=1977258 RepID=UPI00299F175B|nr:bifunctional diguanylate cyclase/phosphodiesterase [Arsukibacterium sp.]MDX1677151.1 bifunctional diguanylate cyclase/phosphodiesterase [Arsukibacterium sp.]
MPAELFARTAIYVTQTGLALLMALLLWYYLRVYRQTYLKVWLLAFVTFAGYQFAILLLYTTDIGRSWVQVPLAVLIHFGCYSFALLMLLGNRLQFPHSTNQVLRWPAVRFFIVIFIISCAGVLLPLAFPVLQYWQPLLESQIRFTLTGILLFMAGIGLWQSNGRGVGPKLASVVLMLWGLLYLVNTLSDMLMISTVASFTHMYLYKSIELTMLVTLGFSLIIWLQENERSTNLKLTEKTRYLDQHDQLTGALNRDALLIKLDQLIATAAVGNLHLVMLGLDKFKNVNESVGLKQGDRILREVIRRLEQSIVKPVLIARTGGDIFALVLADVVNDKQLQYSLQHIQQLIEKPFLLDSGPVKLTTSIGLAHYPTHADSAERLLQQANIAFHQAKRLQASWISYQAGMEEETARLLAWESELLQAINEDQFVLYYQPQLSLRSNQLEGFEVLVRWQHPERGLLMPGEFLPLCEQLGLNQVLDLVILRNAIASIQRWQKQGVHIPLAVNMSPVHFQQEGLKQEVKGLLQQYSVSPEMVELEVTENTAMQDMEKGSNFALELQQMGIKVSIDDFGTGYSSLAYLRKMPIEKIKIDRSFVMDMTSNDSDMMIVKTMIKLAHGLGKRILAEGVETIEQLDLLRSLSCDAVQGYYIARPLPETEALAFIKNYPC